MWWVFQNSGRFKGPFDKPAVVLLLSSMVIWATTILENPPYLYMTQDKAFLCPPCGVLNNPEPWESELITIKGC